MGDPRCGFPPSNSDEPIPEGRLRGPFLFPRPPRPHHCNTNSTTAPIMAGTTIGTSTTMPRMTRRRAGSGCVPALGGVSPGLLNRGRPPSAMVFSLGRCMARPGQHRDAWGRPGVPDGSHRTSEGMVSRGPFQARDRPEDKGRRAPATAGTTRRRGWQITTHPDYAWWRWLQSAPTDDSGAGTRLGRRLRTPHHEAPPGP